MLTITIKDQELFDERIGEFVTIKGKTIQLEHSLVSISKWESKWRKPFLSKEEKTPEEVSDYIKCMTITSGVSDELYLYMGIDNLKKVKDYIDSPMTATTFSKNNNKPNREIVTSELIYYWMIDYGIPFECEKWHLNRLLTLVQVCSVKNNNGKMSKKEVLAQNKAMNQARRAKANSKG